MTKTIDLLILFGGQSPEHEVSRDSATFIAKTLSKNSKYTLHFIGINKAGQWYYYSGDLKGMKDGSWEDYSKMKSGNPEDESILDRALLSADSKFHYIYFPFSDRSSIKIDCVFPVLHGANGEDGRLQGMLEMAGVPFVGCGMLSSALAMDKYYANKIMEANEIPHTKWCKVDVTRYRDDVSDELDNICCKLDFPIFVKPANAGSSIGISRVESKEELKEAIDLALDIDERTICEEAVIGRELEIAALGSSSDLMLSVIGEIIPDRQFYDYAAKYEASDSKLIVPADLSESQIEEINYYARKAFDALDCYGMARIDFFLSESGEVIVNEVNTIPGFVDISMYPRLFAASGVTADDLLDRLIDLSFDRYLHGKK